VVLTLQQHAEMECLQACPGPARSPTPRPACMRFLGQWLQWQRAKWLQWQRAWRARAAERPAARADGPPPPRAQRRASTLEAMLLRSVQENARLSRELAGLREECAGGAGGAASGLYGPALPQAATLEAGGKAGGGADGAGELYEDAVEQLLWAVGEEGAAAGSEAGGDGSHGVVGRAESGPARHGPAAQPGRRGGGAAERGGSAGALDGALHAGCGLGAGGEDAAARRAASDGRAGEVASPALACWEIAPGALVKGRCIGRGRSGAVWVGQWRHARVAIKELGPAAAGVVPPGHVRAFRGEAAQRWALRHPNLLTVVGAVAHPAALAIVTEARSPHSPPLPAPPPAATCFPAIARRAQLVRRDGRGVSS